MNRFNQADLLIHIAEVDKRMIQAKRQMLDFASSITQGVYSRWTKYIEVEPDSAALEASREVFAAKARDMVDECLIPLAAALDIIAGGMRDTDGEPLTRQDLLDELSAVIVPEE